MKTPEEWAQELVYDAKGDAMVDDLPAPFLRDRIADMVRQAISQARAEEREQIADYMDDLGVAFSGDDRAAVCGLASNAIRERGNE